MSKEQFIDKKNFFALAEALRSIGHPERIAIVYLICLSEEKRMMVKNIYESLEMEQPIVSRHLGILRRSQLLERKTEGASTFYSLCKENKIAEQIYNCVADKSIKAKS